MCLVARTQSTYSESLTQTTGYTNFFPKQQKFQTTCVQTAFNHNSMSGNSQYCVCRHEMDSQMDAYHKL